MSNDLIKKYVEDNIPNNLKKIYESDLAVAFTDDNNDLMYIERTFNTIFVHINGEFYHSYVLDKFNDWVIAK